MLVRFTHVIEYINIFFYFVVFYCSMHIPQFIHSFLDIAVVSSFWFLLIKMAVNIFVLLFVGKCFHFSSINTQERNYWLVVGTCLI